MTSAQTADAFRHWADKSQPGEKSFHLTSQWRNTPLFMENTATIFAGFGLRREQFAGELIVDIGAGSKLRSKYFTAARIAAIEPLADDFVDRIAWCDLRDAERLYSLPAEQRIKELQGQAAFAMCMNVLDHTYDPAAILKNIHSYLKPGGELLLSVDLHDGQADDLHPVALDAASLRALAIECGFAIGRAYQYLADRPSYGHGFAYTLVLTPRAAGQTDGSDTPTEHLMSPRAVSAWRRRAKLERFAAKLKRLFGRRRAA